MKTTRARFTALAALAAALFVPSITAQSDIFASGGRPPIPPTKDVIQITPTCITFSNGLTVDAFGTITYNGMHYFAMGSTILYPDGNTVLPNGTIVYSDGSTLSLSPGF